MKWIRFYLIWNIIELLHGLFEVENYWDWKALTDNAMILIMPIMAYAATNLKYLQQSITLYIKYALPFFILIFPFVATGAYGFYLVPVGFLMLFFPLITNKWKAILLALALLVIVIDFDARSNVIKFTVPLLLLLLLPFKNVFSTHLFEYVRKIFFIIPLIFFFLAASGAFNIFKMDEYISGTYVEKEQDSNGEIVESDLTADTRTGLYVEVLNTAEKYNTWVFGRSPARGNETELFATLKSISGKQERLGNEVAILNIFTWTGIIGVILYGLVFYTSSYKAINQSRNVYSKLLGLFVIFRWAYAWVEDVNEFSLNYTLIWFMIGLCYSKSFRQMTDKEVKVWVRGMFDKKYQILKNKKLNKINAADSYIIDLPQSQK